MDMNRKEKYVLTIESIHFNCPAVGYAVWLAPLR